jgi:hypothetical protein
MLSQQWVKEARLLLFPRDSTILTACDVHVIHYHRHLCYADLLLPPRLHLYQARDTDVYLTIEAYPASYDSYQTLDIWSTGGTPGTRPPNTKTLSSLQRISAPADQGKGSWIISHT